MVSSSSTAGARNSSVCTSKRAAAASGRSASSAIVLVALHIGFDKLGRDQFDMITAAFQLPAPVVRGPQASMSISAPAGTRLLSALPTNGRVCTDHAIVAAHDDRRHGRRTCALLYQHQRV